MFKIKNKIINNKSKTYIIAEIGINHLGDKNICIRQINSAIKCGADAVKLQIADYEESYSKDTQSYKIFKKYSLNLDDLIKINNYCKRKNITIFATPSGKSVIKIIKKLEYFLNVYAAAGSPPPQPHSFLSPSFITMNFSSPTCSTKMFDQYKS